LHLIGLTAVVVVAEFVAALLFVARAGAVLTGSPRGGALAGVLFAGCPMAFWWTAIGQETGMLVLSAAAILYFLSAAGEGAGIAAAVLAGGAAGLAALAREYGPAFVVLGLVACAWLRVGWRRSAVFAAVAVVLAAPWYARVDALTGNPIWSNRFLGLPVNAVHAAIMDYYTTVFSPRLWSARDWMSVIGTVFLGAPLVLPLGMAAGLSRFPRRGFLLIFAAGVIALFLWSASYTAGGKDYAVRVATPALVPLAILAAALLDRTPPSTATGLAVAAAVFTALWCWALPFTPAQVRSQSSRSAVAAYLQAGFQRVPSLGVDARVVAGIRTRVPKGGMVLTDSMYLPQFLDSLGIRTAPVWRPDLAFLFDRSLPLQEAFRKLRAAGITHIVYRPFVPPGPYLQRFAAFSPEADRTVWLTELDVIINVP